MTNPIGKKIEAQKPKPKPKPKTETAPQNKPPKLENKPSPNTLHQNLKEEVSKNGKPSGPIEISPPVIIQGSFGSLKELLGAAANLLGAAGKLTPKKTEATRPELAKFMASNPNLSPQMQALGQFLLKGKNFERFAHLIDKLLNSTKPPQKNDVQIQGAKKPAPPSTATIAASDIIKILKSKLPPRAQKILSDFFSPLLRAPKKEPRPPLEPIPISINNGGSSAGTSGTGFPGKNP